MKKFLISTVAFILGLSVCTQPVFATTTPETFGVEAAILKDCASKADDADGGGIICILEFKPLKILLVTERAIQGG